MSAVGDDQWKTAEFRTPRKFVHLQYLFCLISFEIIGQLDMQMVQCEE
jgi:hypothetical protein